MAISSHEYSTGSYVCSCVLHILNQHVIHPDLNYTHVVPLPKCIHPEAITNFRPISLCNVVYKLASKAIANHIKPIMDIFISQSQSLVPGCLILDDVLVAYEFNHHLAHKYKGNVGHVSLKLDLSKSYDREEWLFLERVLLRLGFDSHFVALIMLCVSSVSFSFLLNGSPVAYLRPRRGLHQGDPLSPLLFLFYAEAFSGLVRRAEEDGSIRGFHLYRHGPEVTHLLFADDTVIFYDAKLEAITVIRELLKRFKRGFGLQTNYKKSAVVFSRNVPVHESKHEVFVVLKREGMATTSNLDVEAAILSEKSSTDSDCHLKIHWLSWSELRKSEEEGGLGFKRLRYRNLAMLPKQAWRLVQIHSPFGAQFSLRGPPVNGREEFAPIDVVCILQIVPGIAQNPDEQIWNFGTKGNFSIQSAYGLFQNKVVGASSSTTGTGSNWKGY
ncbi:Retrovirus-related Pol polyprotein from type-1 retrotransposable element R2 [Sesamum angolense]|uniref:Retrovirus-related Pol polyprotein from type-1 retrotransposable element R2 n=1 Tax=Sesamum angolense TaxID=2727404 RepID=A0AAE2BK16_9LAMI|nr:Retrovirus-related Pol polyprotein from type-1 retrotransposable element R2 [Sesamum angolense]